MSASDDIVMQSKDPAAAVTWGEYEALRDTLTALIE